MKKSVTAKELGEIKIIVYRNEQDNTFFYIQPESEQLLDVVDVLEKALEKY